MKKVLLASTVLAMTATVAAAEVTVSGAARMGLIKNADNAATVGIDEGKVQFTSRVRVSFAMSGETDGGLAFGAGVRADQSGQGNTANNDSTVFISGAFGKLTFGDVDTAANALVGNVSGVGLTGLGDLNELGYIGHNKTAALYTYSAGALSVALSAGQIDQTTADVAGDKAASVAVKYAADAYYVALGYETAKSGVGTANDNQLTLGLGGSFNGLDVKFVAADRKSAAKTHYALSVGYTMDALGVTAFYAEKGVADAYGIGASYDLGGGAKVVGGIAKAKGSDAVADVGVSMSF